MKDQSAPVPYPTTFLGRLLAAVLTLALLAIGIMFSLVVFAVVAVAGVIGIGVWWWKTRHLRQMMREAHRDLNRPNRPVDANDEGVIEGESVVINVETKNPS